MSKPDFRYATKALADWLGVRDGSGKLAIERALRRAYARGAERGLERIRELEMALRDKVSSK